jgi:hypothetical protein
MHPAAGFEKRRPHVEVIQQLHFRRLARSIDDDIFDLQHI